MADMLLKELERGNVFFFAGSGVSYLSQMATVGELLHRSASMFLPRDEEWQRFVRMVVNGPGAYSVQPEVFYEMVLDLTGSIEALGLWRCLSIETLRRFGVRTGPNTNHMFVADYSSRHCVPIFTTNFDCLFEKAGEELGLSVHVVEPNVSSESSDEIYERLRRHDLVVFKLHGSVSELPDGDLTSLFTTMRAISTVNTAVLDFISGLRKDKHIVFVGYSGRDIDYFPEIRRQRGLTPFWVDRFKDASTLRSALSIAASRVLAYPDEIFSVIAPRLERHQQAPDPAARDQLFNELCEGLQSIPFPDTRRRLLLGMCLHAVGRHRESCRVLVSLDDSPLGPDKAIYLVTLARVLDCLSDYPGSEKVAAEALGHVRKVYRGTRGDAVIAREASALQVLALHQRCMARKLQLGPVIRYGGELDYRPAALRAVAIALEYGLVSLRMRYLLRAVGRDQDSSRDPNPSRIDTDYRSRAQVAYLDHCIMIFAFVEEALGRMRLYAFPGVRRLLGRWLRHIESRCGSSGDYFTRSNVKKYTAVVFGEPHVEEAIDICRLLNDPLTEALVNIRQGRLALEDRGSLRGNQIARASFTRAYCLSLRCGSSATALKALVGLYYSGSPAGAKWRRYSKLKNGILGEGYAAYFELVEKVLHSASPKGQNPTA